MITLITAFRERTEILERCIKSIVSTATYPGNVQLLLAIDDDDQRAIEWCERCSIPPIGGNIDIRYTKFKRSDHFTKDYINPLARSALGDWLININDDCVFMTKGWDEIIESGMLDHRKKCKDPFFLGLPRDGMSGNQKFRGFSCFPVMPKEAADFLGFFMFEGSYIWGADIITADIFRKIDRLFWLDSVLIDHISVHTGKAEESIHHARFSLIHDTQPKISDESVFIHSDRMREEIKKRKERR